MRIQDDRPQTLGKMHAMPALNVLTPLLKPSQRSTMDRRSVGRLDRYVHTRLRPQRRRLLRQDLERVVVEVCRSGRTERPPGMIAMTEEGGDG